MTDEEKLAAIKRRLRRGAVAPATQQPIVVNINMGDFFEKFATPSDELRIRESTVASPT